MSETFRAEYVKCGKPTCGSCPHGPYWYGYQKRKGKLHKRYIGKVDPHGPGKEKKAAEPWEAILNERTASASLAWTILGMSPTTSKAAVTKKLRALAMEHHPDRGGNTRTMQCILAAYSYLKHRLV